MTALATAFQRMWSATNRLPRLTGRGTPGGQQSSCSRQVSVIRPTSESGLATRAANWTEEIGELVALAKRTAPTVIIIALRIFR